MALLTIVVDITDTDNVTMIDPHDVAEDIMACYASEMRAGNAGFVADFRSAEWNE